MIPLIKKIQTIQTTVIESRPVTAHGLENWQITKRFEETFEWWQCSLFDFSDDFTGIQWICQNAYCTIYMYFTVCQLHLNKAVNQTKITYRKKSSSSSESSSKRFLCQKKEKDLSFQIPRGLQIVRDGAVKQFLSWWNFLTPRFQTEGRVITCASPEAKR